jgi:hypothetical protein
VSHEKVSFLFPIWLGEALKSPVSEGMEKVTEMVQRAGIQLRWIFSIRVIFWTKIEKFPLFC